MTWPRWFRRAVRNRHRHAIEQVSRRWRGGRRRRFRTKRASNLISTQVAQETLKGMKEAQKSMKRGVDNAAGCCLLAKDSCLRNCLHAGADKHCNTDDNQILLRSSICEGCWINV